MYKTGIGIVRQGLLIKLPYSQLRSSVTTTFYLWKQSRQNLILCRTAKQPNIQLLSVVCN
jgi:hypothetical protein